MIAVFSGTCENLASHGLNGGAVADLVLRHKKSLGIEDPLALPKNANHFHGIARMNFKWQSDHGCSDIAKLMATELRQRTDAAAIFHGYITAAATLLSDIDVAPPSCEITQAAFAAWLTTTHGLAMVCPTRPEGQPCSLASLITSWTRQVSCDRRVFRWDTHSSIAAVLVRGAWPCELRALISGGTRETPESTLAKAQFSRKKLCSLSPSRADIQRQIQLRVPTPLIDHPLEGNADRAEAPLRDRAAAVEFTMKIGRRHKFRKKSPAGIVYAPWFLSDCVIASANMRNVEKFNGTASDTLATAVLQTGASSFSLAAKKSGFQWPKRFVLRAARVRLDCCLMLMSRIIFARSLRCKAGPFVTREFLIDASRAFGREILATRENTLTFTGTDSPPQVVSRRMPTVSLAHGHMTAPDKMMGLLHAVWLERGPTAFQMREWCRSVRAIPTDMGTETSIANAKDALAAFLEQDVPGDESGFTFLLGVRISGWNHMLDNSIKYVCSSGLPWFTDWLLTLRKLGTFLTLKGYRDVLEVAVEEQGAKTKKQIDTRNIPPPQMGVRGPLVSWCFECQVFSARWLGSGGLQHGVRLDNDCCNVCKVFCGG